MEIKSKLNSLSIFIGTGECNGNCKHCAGIPLRKYAPKEDGIIYKKLIKKTIIKCYKKGTRSLSISSSGEPTLSPISVTKLLMIVNDCKNEGVNFNKINLYSNGIRIGNDKMFYTQYLPLWKELGLTRIYITVHDPDPKKNAKFYGIKDYPSLKIIVDRIHRSGIKVRANLVLSNSNISSFKRFKFVAEELKKFGFDHISAWPVRTLNDNLDTKNAPSLIELDKIEAWIKEVGYGEINLLRENSRRRYDDGEKLTLFPNGTLSNKWCN